MNKLLDFEITVFDNENREDQTHISFGVTEEEYTRLLESEQNFNCLEEDSSLADLTERVRRAAADGDWLPFEDRDDCEDLVLTYPDSYSVNYPDQITAANRAVRISEQRKRHKLKGLRWGYDGGGKACGPIDGSTLVEAAVADPSGTLLFVSLSRFTEFAKVTLSRAPLFDILMQLPDMDLDFDQENEIIEELTEDSFEFEYDELPDHARESSLNGIYRLLLAAEAHCPTGERCEDFDGAREFLAGCYDKTSEELLALDSFPKVSGRGF